MRCHAEGVIGESEVPVLRDAVGEVLPEGTAAAADFEDAGVGGEVDVVKEPSVKGLGGGAVVFVEGDAGVEVGAGGVLGFDVGGFGEM